MTASDRRVTADIRWREPAPEGPVFGFFLLTYAVSWLGFASSANRLSAPGVPLIARELSAPLYLVGVFAPALVALALTARQAGGAGVGALLHRISPGNVGPRWYLLAVAYMPVIKLTGAVLHRLLQGAWPRFGAEPWYVVLGAIVVSTPVQAGEEIGWRGYALPRLAVRVGLARGSLLLGVVWAAWHLPFFFMPGVDKSGQSFPVYLLGVSALSVALAWLYWRTDGNLLLTMLMHSAINQTSAIVPTTVPGATNPFSLRASLDAWLTVALLWSCATLFLWQMRHEAEGLPRSGEPVATHSGAANR